ncbi:MAG: PepSY domain-containing protein [Nitrospirae bacterium]|nr:PepSY domain-containing protein [Nitrospirota bacterium]
MKGKKITQEGIVRMFRRWTLMMFSLTIALLLSGQAAIAQNEHANDQTATKKAKKLEDYFTGKENLNDYFGGKYKFHPTGYVRSSIRPTPHGPKGDLDLTGVEIEFKNVSPLPGELGRARAIARAFMEEEAVILGITDMEELREYEIKKFDGFVKGITHIYYRRYIGDLELEGAYIDFTIWPDGTITRMYAYLVPVSPEVYDAVRKERITKDKALKIIEHDLKSAGSDPKRIKIENIQEKAVPDSPYVIWEALVQLTKGRGRWLYRIDAFTGEILKKLDMVIID